jgi:molybdopterin-guanine dinucleotide biosynthesis protein A
MGFDTGLPPAVILSGGAGRRIGGRKELVALGGRPLIAHVIDRVRPQVSALAINADPDPALEVFGLPILPDAVTGLGPLGGILTALRWAEDIGAARVVTVAVDTPFLPPDLVDRLSADAGCAAFAETIDGPHATTAIWSVDLRSGLEDAVRAGVRRVRDWTSEIGADAVMFQDASAFLNVNTPDDLLEAERRLGR